MNMGIFGVCGARIIVRFLGESSESSSEEILASPLETPVIFLHSCFGVVGIIEILVSFFNEYENFGFRQGSIIVIRIGGYKKKSYAVSGSSVLGAPVNCFLFFCSWVNFEILIVNCQRIWEFGYCRARLSGRSITGIGG